MAAKARPSRRRLIGDTRAVTAMEYALIGSLIAIVIVVAVAQIGTNLQTTFALFASSL